MSSLIACAVYDTVENKRSKYTEETLQSLERTVDFNKHRLFIIDNNSCEETKIILSIFENNWILSYPKENLKIITLPENIGTARAINLAWKQRLPGEHCVKLDNDTTVATANWIEELEEVIERDSTIGQVGLKRKDLLESPYRNDWFKSELIMLPHEPGQRWIIVEKCNHIMGTLVLHSSKLIDKIGYLQQPDKYGFDDSLYSLRANLAGFKTVFLPHIEIEHIDNVPTDYWKEKQDLASRDFAKYNKLREEYINKKRDLYYED